MECIVVECILMECILAVPCTRAMPGRMSLHL